MGRNELYGGYFAIARKQTKRKRKQNINTRKNRNSLKNKKFIANLRVLQYRQYQLVAIRHTRCMASKMTQTKGKQVGNS